MNVLLRMVDVSIIVGTLQAHTTVAARQDLLLPLTIILVQV